MAGQSATISLSKARANAKGAGCDYSPGETGGSRPTAPTEGKTLGDSSGKSASSGDMGGSKGSGKSKQKMMY